MWAFTPPTTTTRSGILPVAVVSVVERRSLLSSLNAKKSMEEAQDCECENPDDTNNNKAMSSSTTKSSSFPYLVNQKGSGEIFRSLQLTDVDGNTIRLGDRMGNDDRKSVVIFLRHLG